MSRTPNTITLISKEDRALAAYAGNFRKNHPEYRLTLRQASRGQTVDLASLRGALFGAMRCATTSNGQSMGRRRDAEQIERLWNRLPGSLAEVSTTPTVQVGTDTAQVEAALDAARQTIDELVGSRDLLAAQLVEAQGAEATLRALHRTHEAAHAETHAALGYARELLGNKGRAQVDGFIDGWNAAR